LQRCEGVVHTVVPVDPCRLVELLPARAMAGQPGQQDLEACGFEVLRPPENGLCRAREAVAQQHSNGPAATRIRLRVGMYGRGDR
jgi:hypothetical protein